MTEQDIIRKVKLLREMQRMAEEAQAEAEALKDELKAYMGDSEELHAGEYKGDVEARHQLQNRHPGAFNGHAGRSCSVHPFDHYPPLSSGIRKAPCVSADQSKTQETVPARCK